MLYRQRMARGDSGRWRLAAVVALAFAALSSNGTADGFVAGLDDVPLMPGLAMVADSALVFDAPSGRIVQAEAAGAVTPEAVSTFYRRTLPQLGWSVTTGNEFRREAELLRLDMSAMTGDTLRVRFTVAPAAP